MPVTYRGFDLIAYWSFRPQLYRTGVSIHDGAVGIVGDQPTADAARRWIDVRCAQADAMLAKVLEHH